MNRNPNLLFYNPKPRYGTDKFEAEQFKPMSRILKQNLGKYHREPYVRGIKI